MVQQAVIHPNHVFPLYGMRGGVAGVARKGPSEPLCSWHAELAAWEEHERTKGESVGYPEPEWHLAQDRGRESA